MTRSTSPPQPRFAFKRLAVYQESLAFYAWALEVAGRLPSSRLFLADQLRRAALSIPLNIAEGAGSWHIGNKRKYYGYARGSTFECAALLDALRLMDALTPEEARARELQLTRIGASLTRLCQRYAARPTPGPAPMG